MSLSPKELRLLRLVAAISASHWEDLRSIRLAAPEGEPDRAWREAILQCHLFVGFPRIVESFEVLDRVGGMGTPEPDEVCGDPDLPERGAVLFDRIYGRNAEAVRSRLEDHHPDFARWIAGHAYGRVLTRPGLAPDRRELLAVAALIVTGLDRQLASHARGAVHCGATTGEVTQVLDTVADYCEAQRLEKARSVLERFARAE